MSAIVHCGDNKKLFQKLQNNSIDLILTDPPYKTFQSQRPKVKAKEISARDFDIDFFINEMARVLKSGHHFYIWVDHLTFSDFFIAIQKHPQLTYKNMLVWVKNNHGTGDLFSNYAPQHELVIFGVKKGIVRKFQSKRPSNVIFKKVTDQIKFIPRIPANVFGHATAKPVEILQQFIEVSSKKNEVVLDPYAGSFSTGEACFLTNRNCILAELDPTHCKKGKQRLKKLGMKLNLRL